MSKTHRGFELLDFEDRYNAKCSLQKSSLATEDAIWFGVDDPDPKVMCADAWKVGVHTTQDYGWTNYHIPEEVLLNTRMHLTQDQVRELLPYLIHFAETGELPDSE